jgi:hypothetical protein
MRAHGEHNAKTMLASLAEIGAKPVLARRAS